MALLLSAVGFLPAQNLVDVPLDGLQLRVPVSYTHLDVYKRQRYSNMKSNKYLTIGLLTGFIVGGCIGVLAWAFLQMCIRDSDKAS